MSTEPQSETSLEPEERPRLAWVKIGGWPGLGGNVGFDVGDRVTVLVGKNGAGKSLIMEGLSHATDSVLFGAETNPSPRNFACKIARPPARKFSFEYRLKAVEPSVVDSDEAEPPQEQTIWYERCWLNAPRKDLWKVEDAQLQLGNQLPRTFVHDEGLVARAILTKSGVERIPLEAKQLAEIFQNLHLIAAGVPRGDAKRREILLRRRTIVMKGKKNVVFWQSPDGGMDNISALASSMLRMSHARKGLYDEFVELLQQLEIVREIKIRRFVDPTRKNSNYAAVEFDGVNIGLCSDGTQRIAQIIAQLLSPRTRCLLIEEPETAVHPSLLARLLAILDSYSHDRQIIIATHSPQIVDWCKPEDLRLVERAEGQTRVRNLDEKELGRVYNYLTHDGTLSDFVYRQSSQ